MDIQVVVASIEDLEVVVALERECFSSEAFSRQQLSYLLRDDQAICLIAKVEGVGIVGFVILQLESDFVEGVVFGHVVTLNVAVVFRRRGVAQRLLLGCEEVLRLQGVFECRLEVRQSNGVALELYRQMGYVEVGVLKKYYGKEHGLYLKKSFR